VPQNRILLREDELNLLSNDVKQGHAQVFGDNFGSIVQDLEVRNSLIKSRITEASRIKALSNSLAAHNPKSHITSQEEALEFHNQESQSRELIPDDQIEIKNQVIDIQDQEQILKRVVPA
jgi:hypothetical protein